MKTRLLALAAVCLVLSGPLAAQTPAKLAPAKVTIGESAGYDLSLRCYQFYDVDGQIAAALSSRAKAGTPEAEELAKRVVIVKSVKNAWNLHIDKAKGDRKKGEIDTDLAKAGEPIVADANASLGGNAEAKGRMEALHAECKAQESVTPG